MAAERRSTRWAVSMPDLARGRRPASRFRIGASCRRPRVRVRAAGRDDALQAHGAGRGSRRTARSSPKTTSNTWSRDGYPPAREDLPGRENPARAPAGLVGGGMERVRPSGRAEAECGRIVATAEAADTSSGRCRWKVPVGEYAAAAGAVRGVFLPSGYAADEPGPFPFDAAHSAQRRNCIQTCAVPDHPHDARGVLSYLRGGVGAYGYLEQVIVEGRLAAADRRAGRRDGICACASRCRRGVSGAKRLDTVRPGMRALSGGSARSLLEH